MHALLAHLAGKGFPGAPRPLGFDEQGREVLTFLEGETIGSRKPRPAWMHAEDTLAPGRPLDARLPPGRRRFRPAARRRLARRAASGLRA